MVREPLGLRVTDRSLLVLVLRDRDRDRDRDAGMVEAERDPLLDRDRDRDQDAEGGTVREREGVSDAVREREEVPDEVRGRDIVMDAVRESEGVQERERDNDGVKLTLSEVLHRCTGREGREGGWDSEEGAHRCTEVSGQCIQVVLALAMPHSCSNFVQHPRRCAHQQVPLAEQAVLRCVTAIVIIGLLQPKCTA